MSIANLILATLPLWMRPGVLPEACVDDVPPPSAAKWVWNSVEKPKDGGESYFRRSFVLDAKPVSAQAHLRCDDRGEMYLNGQKTREQDFARHLVPGTNVVAVYVRNAVGFGGVIFRADIECANGQRHSIVSDRDFRSAAKAPKDWMAPGFDDSAWSPAMEQGDVSMDPWSKLADIAGEFASSAEYAAIASWRTNLLPIASLASEPEPKVRVVYRGSRPFIDVNGRELPPYLNLAGVETRFQLSSVLKTAALGFPFFELQFQDFEFERGSGVYDFTVLDNAAHRLLHAVPGAYIFLRFRTNLPRWCAANRGECIGYGKGAVGSVAGDELSGRLLRPSAASPAYRAELTRFHDRLGEFVRARPWAKRVVAIRECWGVYTEWHTFGFYQCPDTGAAMTAAFRRYRNGRYAHDAPPTPEECERPCLLLDPVKDAKTIDFFRCVGDETMALQLHMARDLKRNFPGRLVGAYSGYLFTSFPPPGQNCRYDVLMNSPEIDFCSNPASYTEMVRRPGGSYMQRALPDAFRRHGKLLFLEDDMRFHHVKEWDIRRAHTDTPEESAAVMRRNFLLTLFDGCGIQLCDPFNGTGHRLHAFDDPAILGAMHDAMAALAKGAGGHAGRVTLPDCNEVLVLVDPMARYLWSANTRVNANTLHSLSTWLPHYLHTCGVPVDIADVRDYLAGDYAHRLVFVADAFSLSPDDAGMLAARLKRPGVSAFRLNVAGAPAVPAAIEAVPLPNNAEQWRTLLAEKGAHVWSEAGFFLRRRGGLVGVSVAKAGRYRVIPPPSCTGATELFSDRKFTGKEIEFETPGPDTLLLNLQW